MEAGERPPDIESRDLLRKIREFTVFILENICRGRLPILTIDKFRNYCEDSSGDCCCNCDSPKGKEIISFLRRSHAHRLDVLLRILTIVQKLLQEDKHASKRDIYYMHPDVFSEQRIVDRAINDISILLGCSRHNLNVVSVGNGLLMGWVRFNEDGKRCDGLNAPNTVYSVPVHVERVEDIVSTARYIVIVEKESVFLRLANDQFCSKNRCIIVTGRGYPDVPTRRFLHLMVEMLHLRAYCLVDCDPYGFDILTTYSFGSMEMAYDAKYLRVPGLCWIGAFPSDPGLYDLPEQCLLPLTDTDKSKIESILRRCYLEREAPKWRSELELMLQNGVKFELEALSARSMSFLSEEYVPSKIRQACMEWASQ